MLVAWIKRLASCKDLVLLPTARAALSTLLVEKVPVGFCGPAREMPGAALSSRKGRPSRGPPTRRFIYAGR